MRTTNGGAWAATGQLAFAEWEIHDRAVPRPRMAPASLGPTTVSPRENRARARLLQGGLDRPPARVRLVDRGSSVSAKYAQLHLRRRRAQIAARHALE